MLCGHFCSSPEYTTKYLYVHNRILIGQILHLSSQVVFYIEMTFCVHSSSHGLIFCTSESLRLVFSVPKSSQGILLCTKEYKMHSFVISSDFVCVHKSTYWNVVNASVHQQFYCVSCGGINNLIWIFSLHFQIHYL